MEYSEVFHPPLLTSLEAHDFGFEKEDAEAKNLFVKGKGKYLLLTVKTDRRVDLKKLGKSLGLGHLSFGSKEELLEYLSLPPGSVTPFGLLNDSTDSVPLFLDKDFQGKEIYVHPNVNTSSVLLKANDLKVLLEKEGKRVEWIDFPEVENG
ncbi:MAG: YbaK/EbsC family protein [Candidatus Ornithospirochaeta sp.]